MVCGRCRDYRAPRANLSCSRLRSRVAIGAPLAVVVGRILPEDLGYVLAGDRPYA